MSFWSWEAGSWEAWRPVIETAAGDRPQKGCDRTPDHRRLPGDSSSASITVYSHRDCPSFFAANTENRDEHCATRIPKWTAGRPELTAILRTCSGFQIDTKGGDTSIKKNCGRSMRFMRIKRDENLNEGDKWEEWCELQNNSVKRNTYRDKKLTRLFQ